MKCCLLFRFNLFNPILLNRYLHLSDPPLNVVKYYHCYTCGRHDSICGTRRQWPRSMGLTLIITISRPLSRGDLSQSARRPRSSKTSSFPGSIFVKLNWSGLKFCRTLVMVCGLLRFVDLFGWCWTRNLNFPGRIFSLTDSMLYLQE